MTATRRPARGRSMLLTIAALTVAASCSGGEGSNADAAATTTPPSTMPTTSTSTDVATTSPPTTSTSTTGVPSTTTLPAVRRQPLTGAPLGEGDLPLGRPALAVKIDNAVGARRNHTGLAAADIVFEEIVEGDITRFAAVFHSRDAEVVGPIRSGRSQDVDLLASFAQPLFAWSGGNPGVERLIAASTLTDLNWQRGGRGYYRGPGSEPHNLYNDTSTLWSQAPEDHPGAPPPQQFEYLRPGQAFEGDPVAGIALPMAGIDVTWSWDRDQQRFLRSQQGREHLDVLDGRIGADNVLVLGTWYRPSAIDARSPEAQTITEGAPLWVLSGGRVRTGQWVRTEPTEPIRLVGDDGREIELTPGTTWVELARGRFSGDPANPTVEIDVRLADPT